MKKNYKLVFKDMDYNLMIYICRKKGISPNTFINEAINRKINEEITINEKSKESE